MEIKMKNILFLSLVSFWGFIGLSNVYDATLGFGETEGLSVGEALSCLEKVEDKGGSIHAPLLYIEAHHLNNKRIWIGRQLVSKASLQARDEWFEIDDKGKIRFCADKLDCEESSSPVSMISDRDVLFVCEKAGYDLSEIFRIRRLPTKEVTVYMRSNGVIEWVSINDRGFNRHNDEWVKWIVNDSGRERRKRQEAYESLVAEGDLLYSNTNASHRLSEPVVLRNEQVQDLQSAFSIVAWFNDSRGLQLRNLARIAYAVPEKRYIDLVATTNTLQIVDQQNDVVYSAEIRNAEHLVITFDSWAMVVYVDFVPVFNLWLKPSKNSERSCYGGIDGFTVKSLFEIRIGSDGDITPNEVRVYDRELTVREIMNVLSYSR